MSLLVSTTIYNDIIRYRLDLLGLNGSEFLSMIKSTGAKMAGSFPLQCILNDVYYKSDIDIFIDSLGNGYSLFDLYMFKMHPEYQIEFEYFFKHIVKSRQYIVSKARINVVCLSCDPTDFINNTFDFSFCQTYFTGDKLYYHPDTLNRSGFLVNDPIITISSRHTRYIWYDNIKYTNIQDFIKCKLKLRMKKYMDRGFTINMKHYLELKNEYNNEYERLTLIDMIPESITPLCVISEILI